VIGGVPWPRPCSTETLPGSKFEIHRCHCLYVALPKSLWYLTLYTHFCWNRKCGGYRSRQSSTLINHQYATIRPKPPSVALIFCGITGEAWSLVTASTAQICDCYIKQWKILPPCACGVILLSTSASTPLAHMVVVTSCNLRWWSFSFSHWHKLLAQVVVPPITTWAGGLFPSTHWHTYSLPLEQLALYGGIEIYIIIMQ